MAVPILMVAAPLSKANVVQSTATARPVVEFASKARGASAPCATAKRKVQCTNPITLTDRGLQVPCGKCRACRISRAREWSLRMVHESTLSEASSFITLTFGNEHLPADLSIHKADFQRFMKRLRKLTDARLKYFACGEYGEETGRPHYHAILFGLSSCGHCKQCSKWHRARNIPPDLSDGSGCSALAQAWSFGHIDVSGVGYDSARYVADYVQKDDRTEMYDGRNPPFALMSQGIGLEYMRQNSDKLKRTLSCRVGPVSVGLPRYYQKKLAETTEHPVVFRWLMAAEAARKSKQSKEELLDYLKNRHPEQYVGQAYADRFKQRRWNIEARERLKKDKL